MPENSPFFPYDFRNNSFLSDKQMQLMDVFGNSFGEKLSWALSSLLDTEVETSLCEVKQGPLSLFLRSNPATACYSMIDMPPLSMPGIFALNLELACAFIDRLLGGDGARLFSANQFNDLERALERKFVTTIVQAFSDSWKSFQGTPCSIGKIEMNPSFLKTMAKQSKQVMIFFNISCFQIAGMLSLALNCKSLNLMLKHFQENDVPLEEVHRKICIDEEVFTLNLKAVIGNTKLSKQDLDHLKPGDILKLDQAILNPIDILIEGDPILKGRPGLINDKKGILVS
jgi:flagellar motor switch protein FliM